MNKINNKINIDFNNVNVIINFIKVKGEIKINMEQVPKWILSLEKEDIGFLKNFILTSGSLKEIAKLYEVSYPTVRLRLDKLIQKIELNDKEDEPFQMFIKKLAIDSKIDIETAKLIMAKYNEELKGEEK